MRFTLSATFALVASLGLAAACGSTTTTTEEPVATATASDMAPPDATVEPTATAPATSQPTASAAPTATTPPPPEKKAWKDLNHDQRMELMKAEVMPKMSKMFQEFDGKKFAKMDCATCHGKDKTFKMPNPALPKLDPTDSFKKHATKNKAMLEFMFKMTPEMAKTINAPPFDPATGSGFGCMSCHTMEAGKGPKKP